MEVFRRPSPFLLVAALLVALLTACFASGPQKALNNVAEALDKNDSAAFLAQMDMKAFAANEIKNMTRKDQALSSLDSLGRMLGLGGMDQLLGSVLDMQTRLNKQFTRGVGTGEMMAQCRVAQNPDCPWVPESLRDAHVTDLGEAAAVARITTPARMTSWLALRKTGERWLVVGQAMLESTARDYALGKTTPQDAAPAAPPAPDGRPARPAPDSNASGDGVVNI